MPALFTNAVLMSLNLIDFSQSTREISSTSNLEPIPRKATNYMELVADGHENKRKKSSRMLLLNVRDQT